MSFHVKSEYLFQEKEFVGHSGDTLHWKIEMDALHSNEWKCIARMIMEHEERPFCSAVGIPRGGVELSKYLNEYSTQNYDDPYLIVDDVLTTGGSMDHFRAEWFKKHLYQESFGWVVFARTKPQDWVQALFQMPV